MHHFPSSGLATRSGASRAHCTPNWCTHNPQLEQTRTTWCYIQPCTLQPCVITSDTSLDELLGAKFKKILKGVFPCVNTPKSRISGPCKALNLGLHPSRRSKQPGNTRMSFTERTSLYFCVCCVLERSPAETSLTCWHLVTILCPPIHLHIQKSNCQHRGQVKNMAALFLQGSSIFHLD